MEKQKDLLSRSQLKIQDLLDLINDLLDVAKIESGHGLQERAPLDLCEGLRHIVELMKPRAESQNIALRLKIPDRLQFGQQCNQLFSRGGRDSRICGFER